MAEEFTAKLPPLPLGLPLPRAGGRKRKAKCSECQRDVITNSSPKRLNSSRRSKTIKTDSVKWWRGSPQPTVFLLSLPLTFSISVQNQEQCPTVGCPISPSDCKAVRHFKTGALHLLQHLLKKGPGPFYHNTQLLGFLFVGKLEEKICMYQCQENHASIEGKQICTHVLFQKKTGLLPYN